MTTQNYLIIENNVVTNVCLWDENTQTWTPPNDATMLIQAVTSSMIWEAVYTNNKLTDWNLVEQIGAGQIGFTWNGTVLTTNEPKPSIAEQINTL